MNKYFVIDQHGALKAAQPTLEAALKYIETGRILLYTDDIQLVKRIESALKDQH